MFQVGSAITWVFSRFHNKKHACGLDHMSLTIKKKKEKKKVFCLGSELELEVSETQNLDIRCNQAHKWSRISHTVRRCVCCLQPGQ